MKILCTHTVLPGICPQEIASWPGWALPAHPPPGDVFKLQSLDLVRRAGNLYYNSAGTEVLDAPGSH